MVGILAFYGQHFISLATAERNREKIIFVVLAFF